MKRNIAVRLACGGVVLAASLGAVAQNPNFDKIRLTDSVSFNPMAKRGVLKNGFTYYIVPTAAHPGKLFLEFNVKAGRNHEDDDQTEVSHILEHVVFRSSLHYPHSNSLKQYIYDHDISYNAGPEPDVTRFFFEASSDTFVIKSLCLAFQDWLTGKANLQKSALEAEKKIVVEELSWRGTGISGNDLLAQLLSPSRYSDNLIRSNDIKNKIHGLTEEAITRFYNHWYHPKFCGITIVGDINISAVEKLLLEMFDGIANPPSVCHPVNYPILLSGKNKYLTSVDSVTKSELITTQVFFLKKRNSKKTFSDYRQTALIQVFNKMMHNRMSDLSKNVSPETAGLPSINYMNGLYGIPVLRVNALVCFSRSESAEVALKLLFGELERIRRYGFQRSELEDVKSELLSSVSQASHNDLLAEIAETYRDHFVYGEAAPSEEFKRKLLCKFLNEITVEEVNCLTRSWITDTNRVITVQVPAKLQSQIPTETEVLEWYKRIQDDSVSRYQVQEKLEVRVDFDSVYQLSNTTEYTRREFAEIGVTEIKLANGIKVAIKPAVSLNGRVYIEGTKYVGAAAYSLGPKYFSARLAPAIISEMGLGELTKEITDTYTKQRQIKIEARIADGESTLQGNGPEKELETLFQLVYRYFLPPRADSIAYASKMKEFFQFANQKRNTISPELTALLDYPVKIDENFFSADELKQVRYDLCMKMYRDLFSPGDNVVFVLTGVNDVEKTIKIAAKYLGNLPVHHNQEKNTFPECRQLNLNMRKTVVNKNLGRDASDVFLFYAGCYAFSSKEKIKLEILTKILKDVCLRRVREKEAGAYALYSSFNSRNIICSFPKNTYEIKIQFQCLPERSEKLVEAAIEEIELLRENGPTSEDFKVACQHVSKRVWNLDQMNDSRWQSFLVEQYKNNSNNLSDYNLEAEIKSITLSDIQKVARDYLNKKSFIGYVELPETHITTSR